MVKEKEFGGNKSVRFSQGKKAIIMIGHDEFIFKKYYLSNKSWMSDDQIWPIIQKDKGASIMISAFQFRELGFGCPLSANDLRKINEKQQDEKHANKDAAKLKQVKVEKDTLTSSPFVVEFEYGAQNKGYLTYDNFVLQCEDVSDCLKVLYPHIEFYFCVDHSCGHDRQREDGLDAEK